ncbi:MAG: sigma-54-dependent Fis family transcriptional regulator [Gammaproteobacteria bacterium]|nr:sigma-54-dependent Fis family transcriptional regulator [Gammaproteobacteria bacterium]
MSNANVLVVDDESDIRGLIQEILTEEGYNVSTAADASEARSSWHRQDPDLVLLDIWMPETDGITLLREWSAGEGLHCPVVMMSGHGTVETAVEATRLGAFDFIEKPLSLAKLLRTVERALQAQDNGPAGKAVRKLVTGFVAPVGKSAAMRDLREDAKRSAPHNANVLITGEAGSGREAFARYMHSLSHRSRGPYVAVVGAALTEESGPAILLGYNKDGKVVPGKLAAADGGTLYINGVDDLPKTAQKALLAALEAQAYTPVDSKQEFPLDVRVISAAQPGVENRDNPGNLRRDLLSQLSVITMHVPPLRLYSEDVPELLNYYSDKLSDEERLPIRKFSVAAQNRLRGYPWPGNIRDLRNLVHRLLIKGGHEVIGLEDVEDALSESVVTEQAALVKQDVLALPLREAREEFERAYLKKQLILCGGKVGKLATRVGMERTHLYRKLRSLGVDFGTGSTDD